MEQSMHEFNAGDRVKYVPYHSDKPEYGTVERVGEYLMVRWDDCGTVKSIGRNQVAMEQVDE